MHLAFTVEYDGSRFHGYQLQKSHATVQGEIERVLDSLLPQGYALRVAGRTDTGVHAVGQVISIRTEQPFRWDRFLELANDRLCPHVRLRQMRTVPDDFDPRHRAILRHYRYCFCEDAKRSGPILASYVTFPAGPIDWELVADAAARLVGTKNFVSFCTNPIAEKKPVRSLDRVSIESLPPFRFLDLYGRSFLRGMVRNVTGWLIAIGQGRFPPGVIDRLLAKSEKDESVRPAPPQGLYLMRVWYPGDDLPAWYAPPSPEDRADVR